jgi:hypothetical protein
MLRISFNGRQTVTPREAGHNAKGLREFSGIAHVGEGSIVREAVVRCRFICMVVVAVSIAGIGAAAAPASTAGNRDAAGALASRVKSTFPRATQLFANCPSKNTLPLQDGNTGISCEFRAVVGGFVRFGSALTEPSGSGWRVSGFYLGKPVANKWRSCTLGGLGGRGGQVPLRLRAHGVPCSDAQFLANDIGGLPVSHNLRLPGHFSEWWYGTNSLGFVTNTFKCTGTVEVRQGARNPYGHETARCRSRFGDRFSYTFNQSS